MAGRPLQAGSSHGLSPGPCLPWCGWGPLQCPGVLLALGLLQVLLLHHCNPQRLTDPCAIPLLCPAFLSLVVQGTGLNWLLIIPSVTNLFQAPQTCSLFPAKVSWPAKWKGEGPAGVCYSLIPGITRVREHLYIVARLHHIVANKRVDEGTLHHVCGRGGEARLSAQRPGLWAAGAGR